MASLHLPPYKVSKFEKVSLGTDAISRSLADYSSNVVNPYQSEIENIFNFLILPGVLGKDSKDCNFRFKLKDMSLLGLEQKASVYVSLFGCGAISPNQLIELTGVGEKFNTGNMHYIASTYAKIEDSELSKREDEELKFLTGLAEMDQEIKRLIEKN
ncbi:hypothetical protein ES708_27510 [subsurface metagenome]